MKYISLVGIERCGKGTQIEKLRNYFDTKDSLVSFVREPGTTTLGSILRAGMKPLDSESEMYLDKNTLENVSHDMKNLTPAAYFHMMMLQREVLMKKVSEDYFGNKIISDRGHLCTYAYQLCAQKLNIKIGYHELWYDMYLKLFKNIDDIHLFIDITPEESLRRKAGRVDSDEFDKASVDFISNVKTGYDITEKLITQAKPGNKKRFIHIDGMRPEEEVFEDLCKVIQNHFKD